jgi:hypothetical protein
LISQSDFSKDIEGRKQTLKQKIRKITPKLGSIMAPIALKNPFREEGSEGIAEEIFDNADLV